MPAIPQPQRRLLSGRPALAAALVFGLAGCTHTIEPPHSQAIQEARDRVTARAARPAQLNPCDNQPDELRADVSFVYAKPDLDDIGRKSLSQAQAWIACHPTGLIAVAVKLEQHYRNARLETDLTSQRGAAVMAYLQAAGVPANRIVQVSAADDVLTAPSARLWIVANGNGF